MEEWRINFGQNLRHLRQVHGLTQKQMAEILCTSVSTCGKMERCDPTVRIHSGRIHRLCHHFGITAEEMLFQNWPDLLKQHS